MDFLGVVFVIADMDGAFVGEATRLGGDIVLVVELEGEGFGGCAAEGGFGQAVQRVVIVAVFGALVAVFFFGAGDVAGVVVAAS